MHVLSDVSLCKHVTVSLTCSGYVAYVYVSLVYWIACVCMLSLYSLSDVSGYNVSM